jgi:hypothetical protein
MHYCDNLHSQSTNHEEYSLLRLTPQFGKQVLLPIKPAASIFRLPIYQTTQNCIPEDSYPCTIPNISKVEFPLRFTINQAMMYGEVGD